MPRYCEFDFNLVLERAMRVFWSQGYESTSLDDLLTAMQIGRGSFYHVFKSKRHLFFKTLELYKRKVILPRLQLLNHPTSAIKGIGVFMDAWIRPSQDNNGYGCFITNSTLELSFTDKEVERSVSQTLILVEDALTKTILKAKRNGEISKKVSARAAARHIVCLCNGINVLTKISDRRKKMNSFKHMVIENLTAKREMVVDA